MPAGADAERRDDISPPLRRGIRNDQNEAGARLRVPTRAAAVVAQPDPGGAADQQRTGRGRAAARDPPGTPATGAQANRHRRTCRKPSPQRAPRLGPVARP